MPIAPVYQRLAAVAVPTRYLALQDQTAADETHARNDPLHHAGFGIGARQHVHADEHVAARSDGDERKRP